MAETTLDRSIIVVLRIMIGWTFFYAGVWQIWENYDVADFLSHVVTLHDFFALFARPAVLPVVDFLVKWGHLLIGLSLISGLLVRVSAPFAFLLLVTYYCAHLEWPYVENHLNFVVDFQLVYAVVVVYLIAHRAGHVWGVDGLIEDLHMVEHYPALRLVVG